MKSATLQVLTLSLSDRVRAVLEAADIVCKAQTPPADRRPGPYRCPGCSATADRRTDLRAHLIVCDPFRDAAVRRATRVLVLAPPFELVS